MTETLQFAFSGVNVVYSTLLCLVLLYWIIVILGIFDISTIDFDLDVGLDGDVNLDLDGAEGAFSWLGFFNAGKVPIMVFLTIVILAMWVVGMQSDKLLSHLLSDSLEAYRTLFEIVLLIPNTCFGLFVAKFAVIPIAAIVKERKQVTDLNGKICTVSSAEVSAQGGRCEMSIQDGSHVLSARTIGDEVLRKGEKAIIVEHVERESATEDHYVVTRHVGAESGA